MIRRILLVVLLLVSAALALPPLWFALFPSPAGELPAAGRRVVLPSGVGVNVVEQGSGPPVVLVHGLPGSAYDWRVLSEALAVRGRRVSAYDRVGYGRSDPRPDGAYTLAQNAAELVALLEALGLQHATVVGWSYGGGTAMLAAHRDPTRIGRLVLVGSGGPGIEATGPPPFVAALARPVLRWLRRVPPLASLLRASLSRAAFSDQPQPDWWLPDLAANFARPGTSHSYASEMADLEGPVPDPSGLALPILIVQGEDDRLVPVAIARELHRLAPQSELQVVPGGSHMLPVTHAAWLADAIVGFEARTDSDG